VQTCKTYGGNFNRASGGLNSGSLRMGLGSGLTLSVQRKSHVRQRLQLCRKSDLELLAWNGPPTSAPLP
jgi:hypothetical protein